MVFFGLEPLEEDFLPLINLRKNLLAFYTALRNRLTGKIGTSPRFVERPKTVAMFFGLVPLAVVW